jgi:hypothetical protein
MPFCHRDRVRPTPGVMLLCLTHGTVSGDRCVPARHTHAGSIDSGCLDESGESGAEERRGVRNAAHSFRWCGEGQIAPECTRAV